LLLPEDQKGRFPDGEPAFDPGGAEGIRTPDPLHAIGVQPPCRPGDSV